MSDEHRLVPAELGTLAAAINEEHRRCEGALRAGLAHAVKAGELLMRAKALLPHGAWLPWLAANFEGSERTAQAYMRVAREAPALADGNPQRVADLSFREALAALAEPAVMGRLIAELPPTEQPGEPPSSDYAEAVRAASELVTAIVGEWWRVAELTFEATTGEDAVRLETWCAALSHAAEGPFTVGERAIRRAAWVAYGGLPAEDRPEPDEARLAMRRLGIGA